MKFAKKERVIIVGCGRLGRRLASLLSNKGYQVILIDNDDAAFRKLPESFGGIQIKSDGVDLDTFRYVDADEATMLIACTGDDNLNSLIAQIGSRIFGIPNVYVRFEDTNKELLIKGFNIQGIYPFNLTMEEFESAVFGEAKEEDEEE